MKAPNTTGKIFDIFAKFVHILLTITFAIAVFHELTGIIIIPGMDPIGEQLEIVGYIAITLAGAYPFVIFLTKKLSKILGKAGSYVGANEVAMGGIIAVLANSIPTYNMVKDMNPKGKIMAIAFSVPAATVFGDHMAYTSANKPELVIPLIVGKLVAGILAIIVVQLFTKRMSFEKKWSTDLY